MVEFYLQIFHFGVTLSTIIRCNDFSISLFDHLLLFNLCVAAYFCPSHAGEEAIQKKVGSVF